MSQITCVSAPGTLMLMGEHAVLRDYPALCTAVSQRLSVTVATLPTTIFKIDSNLGQFSGSLQMLAKEKKFQYLSAILNTFKNKLTTGLSLTIRSEFSSNIGFGSSAALLVATLAALYKHLNATPLPHTRLHAQALSILKEVQGQGSGADLAAAIMGGIVYYQQPKGTANAQYQKLDLQCGLPQMVCFYAGYKTPTGKVLAILTEKEKQNRTAYQALFQKMGQLVQTAAPFLQNGRWRELASAWQAHQHCQAQLGTSDTHLDTLVSTLQSCPQILAAKISGSGLGDCVIGLGTLDANPFAGHDSIKQIPLTISNQGMLYV